MLIQTKKKWQEPLLIGILLFLATFVLLTNSPLHIWIKDDAATDSAVFQTVALMMDNGYMPYRDSFDHKGPLLYIINIIGRAISAYNGVWVIEFISLFLTFVFIYKIARLKCTVFESCVTLLVAGTLLFSYFEGGNFVEEYAMPCISISLYVFLDYFLNNKINAKRLAVCGACLGAVVLLRPNMIAAWIVFSVAVLFQCIVEKKNKEIMYFLKFFLLGLGIVIIPICLWLALNHSLVQFWEDYIQFNRVYISAAGGMALFSAKWNSFFTFLNNTIVIIAVVISALCCKKKEILYWSYSMYLFVTLLFICLSGMTFYHYGMVLVPAVAFPLATAFAYCRNAFADMGKGNVITKAISIYLLSAIILPTWLPCVGKVAELYETREEQHSSNTEKEVCEYIVNHTEPEDKISVYGNWGIIYVRSNRMHATRYSYQFPVGQVMPQIMQEYWEQLANELPKVIVVEADNYDEEIIQFTETNGYEMVWAEKSDRLESSAIIYQRIQ